MSNAKISVWIATAVGLGAIIGAGIFVLSGTAISLAGAYSLAAFIAVGIVAIIVALEFGELGAIMPHSKGASYSYVYKAFGSELAFVTGVLKYFNWATAISVISLGFGGYLSTLFVQGNAYEIPLAILLIFVLAVVNLLGIKRAAKTDTVLVVIKILALAAFVAFALLFVVKSGISFQNFTVSQSQGAIASIFAASMVIFFAYSGFQTISTLTPSIKGGANAAARATLYSVLISTVIYVLVVLSMILLLPVSQYGISADPLTHALAHANAPQWLFYVVDIGALVATASAALAMLISASRMLFQMSEDRLLPRFFRKYDGKRDVAPNGVIISAVIAIIALFAGNVFIITSISNFGLLFAYLMTSFALIHFRRAKQVGSFKVPLYPYLPVIAIGALLLFFIGMPNEALLFGVIMIILSILVYYFFREMDNKRIVRVKLFK